MFAENLCQSCLGAAGIIPVEDFLVCRHASCHKHLETYHFWLLLVSWKPIWNCCLVIPNTGINKNGGVDKGARQGDAYDLRSWKASYYQMAASKASCTFVLFKLLFFKKNAKMFDFVVLSFGRIFSICNILHNHKPMNNEVLASLLWVGNFRMYVSFSNFQTL